MPFDKDNKIVKLCARGMELEGEGKNSEALKIFYQAWEEATSHFEKFTAAHYVARHQESVADKLRWDQKALQEALKVNDESVKDAYPSLYLNIAKCYEDLNEPASAKKNYERAWSFVTLLPHNGYGDMIKGGILNGLERVKHKARV